MKIELHTRQRIRALEELRQQLAAERAAAARAQ